MRRIEVAAVSLGVAVAAGSLGWQAGRAVGGALAGGTVAAGLVADVFVRRRVRVWAYREREDDLLVRRGVMFARLSVVPYGRMQFIDVTAGPIERSFRLATVRMHTAAAASDARIPGLPQEEAAAAIAARTRRYAAYQRKWMRRIPGLVMVAADRPPGEVADEILEMARAWERLPTRGAG